MASKESRQTLGDAAGIFDLQQVSRTGKHSAIHLDLDAFCRG